MSLITVDPYVSLIVELTFENFIFLGAGADDDDVDDEVEEVEEEVEEEARSATIRSLDLFFC